MARATWSGFLSFGLVSVPVGLFTATTDQTIHFNQLHKGTSNRVRYKKVDEETGEELGTDDIVNGFPVGDGEYIVVTREEMKEAAPGKSDMIEITDFVDLDDIDPKYFRQTYYLAPKGKGADRAYTLLRQAMQETKKVGIATLVLRDKEHLVAVRPGDDVLMLETMYFEDEIRQPQQELDYLPQADHTDTRELTVAKQLDRVPDGAVGAEPLQEHLPRSHRGARREEAGRPRRRVRRHRAPEVQRHRPHGGVGSLDRQVAIAEATPQPPAEDAHRSGRPPKAAAGHEQQAFEGMSKAELLARAKELEVDDEREDDQAATGRGAHRCRSRHRASAATGFVARQFDRRRWHSHRGPSRPASRTDCEARANTAYEAGEESCARRVDGCNCVSIIQAGSWA